MQQRLPSLLDPPILFAHRGARAHSRENTIEAFQLALKLGATGLESDVWVTSDGVAVLDHDGTVKNGRFRTRQIEAMERAELPSYIPTLSELVDTCGSAYHLSLDLKGVSAGPVVIDTIRETAPDLLPRLWLCDPEIDTLVGLRQLDSSIKLVNSTRLKRIQEGAEVRASTLRSLGIDAINMRQPDWTGGLCAVFHRFGRAAFSWDNQLSYDLQNTLRMGIDGIYSDHVDRMVEAFENEIGPSY